MTDCPAEGFAPSFIKAAGKLLSHVQSERRQDPSVATINTKRDNVFKTLLQTYQTRPNPVTTARRNDTFKTPSAELANQTRTTRRENKSTRNCYSIAKPVGHIPNRDRVKRHADRH